MGIDVHEKARASGRTRAWLRPQVLHPLVLATLATITVFRLIPTYTVFSATYDEPSHIANGMGWLERGAQFDMDQPPLAQIAFALGLYVKGLRSQPATNQYKIGYQILYSDGQYQQNLMLARLANLPFLFLACAVILLWARRWFTMSTAICAVILFLNLPPLLGHAALATVDVACAATVCLALYHFVRWLEAPGLRSAVYFGAAVGVAMLCKFSSIPFLASCFTLALIFMAFPHRDTFWTRRQFRFRFGQLCIAGAVSLILLCAGYRFSSAPISARVGRQASPIGTVDKVFARSPAIRRLADEALEQPFPLGRMVFGLYEVAGHNRWGHGSYIFGKYTDNGSWYFFPVVLSVKTPIGFLLLALGGLAALLWRLRTGPWQQSLTVVFSIAILLVCMSSNLNLGVRHILAIYPLLALMAGHAISLTFHRKMGRVVPAVAVLLVCTVAIDASMAHPDYLAYFNQLAGSHPEKILCESDLDWGQDLSRLSNRLKILRVREVAIGYFGSAPLERANLPHYSILPANEKVFGYVAASLRLTNLEYAKDGSYGWLKQYNPLEKIGRSINLYYIDR